MAELHFNFTNTTAILALKHMTNIAENAELLDCTFTRCAITEAKKECLVSGSKTTLEKLQVILRREGIVGGKLKSDSI